MVFAQVPGTGKQADVCGGPLLESTEVQAGRQAGSGDDEPINLSASPVHSVSWLVRALIRRLLGFLSHFDDRSGQDLGSDAISRSRYTPATGASAVARPNRLALTGEPV